MSCWACLQALRHFIVEVGKGAEDPNTGKPIKAQLVEKLHSQDILKEEKLISLRLKSIELRNKCASINPGAPTLSTLRTRSPKLTRARHCSHICATSALAYNLDTTVCDSNLPLCQRAKFGWSGGFDNRGRACLRTEADCCPSRTVFFHLLRTNEGTSYGQISLLPPRSQTCFSAVESCTHLHLLTCIMLVPKGRRH